MFINASFTLNILFDEEDSWLGPGKKQCILLDAIYIVFY